MNSLSKLPGLKGFGRKAVGALIAASVALAAASPAMADKWNNPGHNKHWKHGNNYNNYYYSYYQPRPRVIYVQPRPIYVQPRPIYVQPAPVYVAPPPVYYVQPAPVYRRPDISIVVPLHFD